MDKHDKTRYVFAQAIKDLIKMNSLGKITAIDYQKSYFWKEIF